MKTIAVSLFMGLVSVSGWAQATTQQNQVLNFEELRRVDSGRRGGLNLDRLAIGACVQIEEAGERNVRQAAYEPSHHISRVTSSAIPRHGFCSESILAVLRSHAATERVFQVDLLVYSMCVHSEIRERSPECLEQALRNQINEEDAAECLAVVPQIPSSFTSNVMRAMYVLRMSRFSESVSRCLSSARTPTPQREATPAATPSAPSVPVVAAPASGAGEEAMAREGRCQVFRRQNSGTPSYIARCEARVGLRDVVGLEAEGMALGRRVCSNASGSASGPASCGIVSRGGTTNEVVGIQNRIVEVEFEPPAPAAQPTAKPAALVKGGVIQ